ncbi:helix-turn-helix domain-containing protein [Sphingomonas sp. 10B4]|uniref:MarR family winged helix-turn-helix transcriptional regulator n=1 Tax=Sphingomonas sp. 10B4 TaxID=3048575 RepID=UPI002AB566BC|nr:helix-turn-helix domain-containing protein [Sphingomonas sp. 10B4]MDY7524622.1 helix-turn-helix domain-containing protein [Sphingomonas sp. 10B4]MEB0282421.1 helix-turn-helix domain-containing protein [Sphingomonas sp. 10B4]
MTGAATTTLSQADYESLAAFRYELRQFLQFSEQAAKALGLTPQQHQALLAIRAAPGQTMGIGDLGEQLFIQPHSASELVDRLVALDLLSKQSSEQDRRRSVLALTSSATAILTQMSTVHRAEVIRIRETLTAILDRI